MILVKGPTDRLDGTVVTAEAKYSSNFSEQQNKFCLSLHKYGSNSFVCEWSKNISIKAKDSKLNAYPLC